MSQLSGQLYGQLYGQTSGQFPTPSGPPPAVNLLSVVCTQCTMGHGADHTTTLTLQFTFDTNIQSVSSNSAAYGVPTGLPSDPALNIGYGALGPYTSLGIGNFSASDSVAVSLSFTGATLSVTFANTKSEVWGHGGSWFIGDDTFEGYCTSQLTGVKFVGGGVCSVQSGATYNSFQGTNFAGITANYTTGQISLNYYDGDTIGTITAVSGVEVCLSGSGAGSWTPWNTLVSATGAAFTVTGTGTLIQGTSLIRYNSLSGVPFLYPLAESTEAGIAVLN